MRNCPNELPSNELRAMTEQIDQIMEVMEAAFDPTWGESWSRRQISDALVMPGTFAILIDEAGECGAIARGEAAGFCLSRTAPGEEELLLIAVKPQLRDSGLGRKLIEQLVADARERDVERIFLEMRSNNPAEYLYRAIGFEPIGKRPKYYRLADGSRLDAITFGLSI